MDVFDSAIGEFRGARKAREDEQLDVGHDGSVDHGLSLSNLPLGIAVLPEVGDRLKRRNYIRARQAIGMYTERRRRHTKTISALA
jgi:hypothetical protein